MSQGACFLLSGRRLEIDRPPTRSGPRTNPKKTLDDLFGDDSDVLGGMGFDDSPKPSKKSISKVEDDDRGKVAICETLTHECELFESYVRSLSHRTRQFPVCRAPLFWTTFLVKMSLRSIWKDQGPPRKENLHWTRNT